MFSHVFLWHQICKIQLKVHVLKDFLIKMKYVCEVK